MKKYLIPLVIIVLIAINFFFFNYYFPGSSLDGIDVSWQKRIEESKIDLKETFTLDAPSLEQVFYLLEDGFTLQLLRPEKEIFSLKILHLISKETILYDKGRLKEEVKELLNTLPDNQAPQDAQLLIKEGELVLLPHQLGYNFPDEDRLLEMIEDAISQEKYQLDLEAFINRPAVLSQDLQAEKNKWREYKLENEDYSWILEGKELYLLYNEDLSLNQEKAQELLEDYFSEADSGNTIWMVDTEESLPLFIEALKNHDPSWEVVYRRVRRNPDSNYSMYNGIAVSIDRQWLWMYRDSQVVFQAPIISGNPNKGYPTHRGQWSILSMDTNTRLANTNREGYSYDVPVNYWMQINYEGMIEGIHDATWHWAFGTDTYLWDGSHGCINLSVADMATLYSLSWVGLPVWVY